MKVIKCVVVGDSGVGKTSLVVSYTTNKFPPDEPYPIAAVNDFSVIVMIGGKPYTIGLFESTGQYDFDRLRPLIYPQTDVFIICYSVVSHTSYESVKDRWESEIRHHCPNTPFLLVGTKIDLRDDDNTLEKLSKNNQRPIGYKEGEQLANDLKAVKYVECSAVTNKGVKNALDEAILIALEPLERRKAKRCTIF